VLIVKDGEAVGAELLHRMLLGGGELVTVVTGEQAGVDLADRLAEQVARAHPAAEVVTFAGGQPHYPLLLGVE